MSTQPKRLSGFPQPSWYQQPTSSRGEIALFLLVVIVVACGWIYRQEILTRVNTTTIDTGTLLSDQKNNIIVGQQINLTGEIEKNTQTQYPYTHIITTSEYGKLGLRSSTINLFTLSGQIIVKWTIVDFINALYIVEVETTRNAIIQPSQVLYFDSPWLLLQDVTQDWFTVVQNTITNTIAIENKTKESNISIRYFQCSDKQDTTNCKQFEQGFSANTGNTSTDEYGNIFYRLNDNSTWFTNIDNRYGIYIETSDTQLFPYIIEHLQFISTQRALQHLSTTAKTYCVNDQWKKLTTIGSSKLSQNDDIFVWNINWTDNIKGSMICEVTFNPENLETTKATVLQSTTAVVEKDISDKEGVENQKEEWNQSLEKDTSVEQIPLKQDKALSFTTHGGITLQFPSPSIYFSSQSIDKGPNGTACSSRINIVSYTNQETVDTDPAVSIYLCRQGTLSPNNNFRVITKNETSLLIEAVNPSWINFANAVTVQ